MLMDTLNGCMFDTGVQVIEVLGEAHFSHDIETKEHGPGSCIEWLSEIGLDLRGEQVCLALDTGFVRSESYLCQ